MTADPSEVQAQLERILASPVFSSSARSAQFLRFCVEQSLKGNNDQIKESTVAVEVFGRTTDFNPRTDPIVRVHAKRLREKLEDYYTVQGTLDPIRITIPKGSYIPQAVRALPKIKRDFSDWPASSVEAAPPVSLKRERRWSLWIPGTVLTVLAIVGMALFARPASVSPLRFRSVAGPVPLNANPGLERDPSWSPDGKTIAFTWDNDSQTPPEVYLQRVGQPQPYRLTRGSQVEYRPVWAPDGKEIAFIRHLDAGHFEVLRTSPDGGPEQKVGTFSYYWSVPQDAPALDWSPDGESLLVAEQSSASSPVRLLIVDLATGGRRALTNPSSGTSGDLEGKISPDGTLVAFHRGGFGDLYVVPIAGEAASPARELTSTNPGIRGISWSRDGRHIFFGSHHDGAGWGIWQVGANGENLSPLLDDVSGTTAPSASPDGTQLAVEHDEHVTNLMAISLDQKKPPHLFAPSSRQDYSPVFSPDGTRVAFLSTRSGPMELWLVNADGSGARQLTRINGEGFPMNPSWSPDGKRIIFALRQHGETNLAVSDLEDGAVRELTFSRNRFLSPVYSADGKSIYYVSNAGGVGRVWRMDADLSGRTEQTYWDVGVTFRESQDRGSIFYRDSAPELHIVKRDLATGALQTVFSSHKQLSAFQDLCVHGRMLYLMVSAAGEPTKSDLIAVDMESSRTQLLQSFDRTSIGLESGCTVSPDGRTLLVTTVQHENTNVYLAHLTQE